jgi:hypothetical protein
MLSKALPIAGKWKLAWHCAISTESASLMRGTSRTGPTPLHAHRACHSRFSRATMPAKESPCRRAQRPPCLRGGTRPALGCGTPCRVARRSSPRPSSTCLHHCRCAQLRSGLRARNLRKGACGSRLYTLRHGVGPCGWARWRGAAAFVRGSPRRSTSGAVDR